MDLNTTGFLGWWKARTGTSTSTPILDSNILRALLKWCRLFKSKTLAIATPEASNHIKCGDM